MFAPLLLLSLSQDAQAASCDAYVQQASTAKGEALITAWKNLSKCDAELARSTFERFMKASGDLETLTALTITAIDASAYNAVWTMMEKVPYEHRESLARSVGESCNEHANVVPFIQGAWSALKGTDFTAWQSVLTLCGRPEIGTWIEGLVAAPPTSPPISAGFSTNPIPFRAQCSAGFPPISVLWEAGRRAARRRVG